MTKPRFDPDDLPDSSERHAPAALYIDVGPEDDLPPDPLTGERAQGSPEPEPAAPAPVKSTRPPWWLIGFTLLIPLAVFSVWYLNWIGRPLSVATINEYLTSSNDKDVYHALVQIAIQAQNAAEEAKGAQLRLEQGYRGKLDKLKAEHSGDEFNRARAELDEQRRQSARNIEEQHNKFYADLELTFESVLAFSANSQSRAPALVEAACGALGVMNRSQRFREPARRELYRLMNLENKVIRRAAACNLANFGDRSGRDIVLEMLDDPDAAARGNAAIALSRIGLQTDAQRLKQLSEKDPDPKVREFAYMGYAALSGNVD